MGDIFINLFVAVGANVMAYYICKWLDSRGKGQYAQKNPLGVAAPRGFAFVCLW